MSERWVHPWTATLIKEGEVLIDRRVCAPGSLEWPQLPIPLFLPNRDTYEASGEVIGRIDEIWREDDLVRARGVADRDLSGEGAAMEVEIGRYTFSSEIVPLEEAEFVVEKGILRAVCVVPVPVYEGAKFE